MLEFNVYIYVHITFTVLNIFVLALKYECINTSVSYQAWAPLSIPTVAQVK